MILHKLLELDIVLTEAHVNFQKGLNSHAYYKTSSHEKGEELVQETFLKTWKYLVKGGEIKYLKTFLYSVLNNLIIDEYIKKKTESLDALLEKNYDLKSSDEFEFNTKKENIFDGENAMKLIDTLPEKYRDVLKMKYSEELTLEEMAKHTGLSKETIYMRSFRGIAKLKLAYAHKLQIV